MWHLLRNEKIKRRVRIYGFIFAQMRGENKAIAVSEVEDQENFRNL
jgi:hypothetical protein